MISISQGDESSRTGAATGSALPASSETSRGKLVHAPFPAFAGTLLLGAARLQVRRWDHALKRPREVQERALLNIVGHAKSTEYRKETRF